MEEKIFRAKFKKFDPEGDTAADMNISALQLEPFLEELGTCSSCMRWGGSMNRICTCALFYIIIYSLYCSVLHHPLSTIWAGVFVPGDEIASLRQTLDPEDTGTIQYRAIFHWFKNLNSTLDQNEASLSSGNWIEVITSLSSINYPTLPYPSVCYHMIRLYDYMCHYLHCAVDDIDELTYESDELDAARLFTPSSGKLWFEHDAVLCCVA